jgi:hypothetical protein
MADSAYRSVGNMFVCAPTNHLNDVNTLLAVVAD